MLVLGHNMHAFCRQTHGMFPKVWSVPFQGIAPNSYVDDGRFDKQKDRDEKILKGFEGLAEEVRMPLPEGFVDPYNVTGTWTRVSDVPEELEIHANFYIGCLLLR